MQELAKTFHLARQFLRHDGHRFAVIETNRDCNRRCSYCAIPQQYRRQDEATIEESLQTVDWLHSQGYRLITWLGGEPFAPYLTKEDVSFFEHTLASRRVCVAQVDCSERNHKR